jgi:hypothetical protein
MATLLTLSVVKGYQKYQLKRSSSSTDHSPKAKRDRKSITSLVIPSIAFAHFPLIDDQNQEESLFIHSDEKIYEDCSDHSAPVPPYSIRAPSRAPPTPPFEADPTRLGYDEKISECAPKYLASVPSRAPPPPPVMLGITLCHSPSAPPAELSGESGYFDIPRIELSGDSPADDVFELHGDEYEEPLSPVAINGDETVFVSVAGVGLLFRGGGGKRE